MKKRIAVNLGVSVFLFAVYLIVYLCSANRITFFPFCETAGTLLLVAVFFHRVESVYYLSLVGFAAIAQFGGTMLNFYNVFPFYDILLHFASGILLMFAGHYVLEQITKRKAGLVLPHGLTIFHCWLFSVAAAGVWEIFEFTVDQLFGFDCQLNSLLDTMTDIVAGTVGASMGIFLLWLFLHKKNSTKESE